ncbi:MAG: hypothetical protein K2N63_04795 [Lachnospiraceae bacterium]|nr:hypothetical protein [Lachnospiraceae bacterium]
MRKSFRKKSAQAVTIIGGSDGPTSIFLVGKGKTEKLPLSRRFKEWYRGSRVKRRRARVIKKLVAEPHTPWELEIYLKKRYHAREYASYSRRAREGFRNTKSSIVWREHRNEMEQLGYPPPETKSPQDFRNRAQVEEWHRYMNEYDEAAVGLSDSLVPMDYHIYGICLKDGNVQVEIEKVRGLINVSFTSRAGKKRCAQAVMRDIYQYYGVTKKDIDESTDRYLTLVSMLTELPGKDLKKRNGKCVKKMHGRKKV